MANNKNGLHDIVMTYIPTKKTHNLQLKNQAVPLPIFKGPIPTLHPTVKSDDEKKNELKPSSFQKFNIIKETPVPSEILANKIEPTNGGGSRSKPVIKIEPTNGGGSRSKPAIKIEPTNGGGSRSKPAIKIEAKNSSKKNNSSDIKKQTTQIGSNHRSSRSNHIASTHLFDLEQTSHKNSFRNVAIKFNSKQKKKRSSRSKKSSKKISKKKSSNNNLKIKKNVPTNLRVDLEKLLNDDDKIILQRL